MPQSMESVWATPRIERAANRLVEHWMKEISKAEAVRLVVMSVVSAVECEKGVEFTFIDGSTYIDRGE